MAQPETTPTTVLIVMAHPDDGEFMCGATIARWAREGRDVHYCVLTNGDVGTTDFTMTSERLAALRQEEQRAAARRLGVTNAIIFLNYVDALLTPSQEVRRDITRLLRQIRPDVVLTQDPTTFYHGQSSINHPDHRAVGEATMAAIMPSASMHLIFPELHRDEGLPPHRVKELYLTNTQHADRWVEVTEEDLNRQAEALLAHASQVTRDPHERVFASAREDAAEAHKYGHDFTYAEGFKYIHFRS